MDLGLAGKSAIVCASSRGLGKACALALAQEGCNLVINGRDETTLLATAKEIEALDVSVIPVVGDLDKTDGRARVLQALPAPDILVTNNGGPPPGRFADWSESEWHEAVNSNMLAPLMLIRAVVDGMRERRFGRIINITSAMVKTPQGFLGLSTASRSGLTAMCKALSREVAADNVTINNLLPERFDTDRIQNLAKATAEQQGISVEQALADLTAGLAAKRMGRPDEFGAVCAFLCSEQAAYVSGQNLLLDGGSYPGVL